MSRPRFSLRTLLTLTVLAGLICSLFSPFLPGVKSQEEAPRNERKGTPRPGKPEGDLKSLEEIKNEINVERERSTPVPSTIRSPKLPLNPWDGRRVGDPLPGTIPEKEIGEAVQSKRARESSERRVRRAHAKRSAPFVVLDDTFIDNFYTWVMTNSYTPLSGEKPYWRDQLRVGQSKHQTALNLAAIEMGKTLFESAYYLARARNDSQYVEDLYWSYLMRAPDTSGWNFWTGVVASHGREDVRRSFEESLEFQTLMTTIVPNGSASSTPASLISAQSDPRNQPGGGLLTRDGTWSLPLISLPGRAGLDLGLSLSYSSQVWTKSGPYLYFDEDNGMPSPGFRLGFPTIRRRVFNSQTNTLSYLLITSSGRRVELRQVGTSNVYEAADSSYLQLTDNGNALLLRSTDGTQLTYQEAGHEWRCNQVKDRNGNYLTITIGPLDQITSITDTLGRVLTFNYDTNLNLLSITQTWGGPTTHTWATFSWGVKTMQSSFSSVVVIGPKNGTDLPVLSKVTANDGANFEFDYNNSLQVIGIRKYHDAGSPTLLRATNTFTYETPASDVPRLTDSRISALNWTGINGVPAQVVTQYSVAGDGACVLTAPDGTIYKEYYGTGYKRGLTVTSEVWSGGVKQKWTTTAWTQDNTRLAYELNPRVTETNIYDASSNRRRTTIEYQSQFGLPHAITEYAADGSSGLRFTIYDYENDSAYLNRRIIGLPDLVHVYDGSWNLLSKTQYNYDLNSSGDLFQDTPAAATQHDRTNYGPSFIQGRGNLSQTIRFDVTDPTNANGTAIETKWRVNSTGSVLLARDHLSHQKQFAYGDDFSDSVNRNTFAYPTVLTDEDGNQSSVKYNFDFGATTRTQGPPPSGQSQGLIQTMLYNDDGLIERVTTTNNGAYQRFWYGPDYVASNSTVNTVADETYNIQYVDGVGHPILSGSLHPGSTGGYKAQQTIYDQMGRAIKLSNPTEITGYWIPTGDDAAGWLYTQQTYNWQGKPLVTTNPDSTTKEVSYSGCGCAGGEVVTLTDEGTLDGGVAKRRQTKIYSDVLGRAVKTELLNWQGGSVYSATVNTYNMRDQVTKVRQYAGAEGSSTYQDTTMTYDGHGRLKTKHVPEEDTSTNTVWTYNSDDTVNTITDPRGAVTTVGYAGTNRRLVKSILRTLTGQPNSTTTFSYDAVGNRTLMSDPSGTMTYSYNQLSQLTAETKTFTGKTGSYGLGYTYNLAGALTSISIPFSSQQIQYSYDDAVRLSSVTPSGFSATYFNTQTQQNSTYTLTSLAASMRYRAWGARKSMTYGNSVTESVGYNSRMLASTYDLNNLNYAPGGMTLFTAMSWTYDYYDDGRLKFSHHPTQDKWDRSYTYDHAARLGGAKTNRLARGQSWEQWNPDPYQQTITYDAFNHSSRTGGLYSGSLSDSGTYANNRRTGAGWNYDTAGNVTFDGRYATVFDAASKSVNTTSTATVGDGSQQFPTQPAIEVTAVHDGDGQSSNRLQVTRREIYEGEDLTQVLTDTQANYYLRSSMLGGQTLVDLVPDGNGGLGKASVYIYANNQRIAKELGGSVTFEHRNPGNDGYIYSHGHPSYRAGLREELDPMGAELPLSDPYWAQLNYLTQNWGEQLFMEGGDPGDYSSGQTVDGMPVSDAQLQSMIDRGTVEVEQTSFNGKKQRFTPVSGTFVGSAVFVQDEAFGREVATPDGHGGSYPVPTMYGLGHWEYIDEPFGLTAPIGNGRAQKPVPRSLPDPRLPGVHLTDEQWQNSVKPAVELATALLKKDACRDYIRGTSSYDPATVLDELSRGGGIKYWDIKAGHADTEQGPGTGSGATIRLHNQYFDDDVGKLTIGGDQRVFSRNPDKVEARAMVLLHELRHATTGIEHPIEELAKDSNADFYDKIFLKCIR